MPIEFDDSAQFKQVKIICDNLDVQGHDLLLDAVERRQANGPTFRRALVHDQSDGLTINFASDYPGGVTINGRLDVTGELQIRITHPDPYHIAVENTPTETVMLADVIKALRGEIVLLRNRIETLERRA